MKACPWCKSQRLVGVEYEYGHPARYDGVSEWNCRDCGTRVGRWSHHVLAGDDYEPRFGVPRQVPASLRRGGLK